LKKRMPAFVFAILGASAVAGAHPMGNFSVNRFARLEPSPHAITVVYIVDFAEIPTFQEISRFPALASLADPAALEAAPESRILAADLSHAWSSGVSVTRGGVPVAWRHSSPRLKFTAGAGGLPTMKLTLSLDAPWKEEGTETVRYADSNAPDRIGWREVILRPVGDLRIASSDVDGLDRSGGLTRYPADPTADIPNRVNAEFRVTAVVGGAPLPVPPAAKTLSRTPSLSPRPSGTFAPAIAPGMPPRPAAPRRSDRFADLISARKLTPGVVGLSLLIALCLGGLHAFSPGHGKTVVAAYLVGSRGTARHALLLGAVVTASHTVGVFLLGIVTLALSKAIVPEKLYPAIQFLSGLTIVVIGASLFGRRLRRRSAEDHGHTHAVEIPQGAPTASALLALGVSGGILPCPSALVVLLSAIALHRIGFGLLLIVAFSMGLAAVLSGIGILVVRAGRVLARFESAGRWARRLPAFSALLIGFLGLVIAARALPEIQHAFFAR